MQLYSCKCSGNTHVPACTYVTVGSCVAETLREQLGTLDKAFKLSAGQLVAHTQATSASIPPSITEAWVS